MNAPATKALIQDAIYQILDNWVFRILTILGGVLVLGTFVVGFRENEIVLLFGLRSWSYDAILNAFDLGNGIADPQGLLIGILTELLFDNLAGNIGLMFCIAATAFFVPQMIEKGAADVLFHKPLSRLTFYLARYFGGLLFVATLATLMAVGIYAGILLVSGYNDPGILMAAPILTYLFGLIFAVSMLIGVVTRSTVASILLTFLFFAFNGCVHMVWVGLHMDDLRRLEAIAEADDGTSEALQVELEADSKFEAFLRTVNNPLHYILPKTNDASVMAGKLRRSVNTPHYMEQDSLVSVFSIPNGMQRDLAPGQVTIDASAEVLALLGEARYAVYTNDPGDLVRYTLMRRPVEQREVKRRGEISLVDEKASNAASTLRDALENDDAIGKVSRNLTSFGSSRLGRSMTSSVLRWERDVDDTPRIQMAVVFKGAKGKFLYTLWISDETGTASSDHADLILQRIDTEMGSYARGSRYEEQFTVSAPWKYNVLFSIGSSLAFVLAMLGLGWWKLSRIEF